MITPFIITKDQPRGTLVEVHIADLHFGVNNVTPEVEYAILEEQFLNKELTGAIYGGEDYPATIIHLDGRKAI